MIKQMKAPVLGANAVDARTGIPAYLPFTMETMPVHGKQPVRVGVLGLTNPGIAIWDKGERRGQAAVHRPRRVGEVLGAGHPRTRCGRGAGDRARR